MELQQIAFNITLTISTILLNENIDLIFKDLYVEVETDQNNDIETSKLIIYYKIEENMQYIFKHSMFYPEYGEDLVSLAVEFNQVPYKDKFNNHNYDIQDPYDMSDEDFKIFLDTSKMQGEIKIKEE